MKTKFIFIFLCAALVSCGKAAEMGASDAASTAVSIAADSPAPSPPPPQLVERAPKVESAITSPQAQAQTIITSPMLAYTYGVSFLLPKDKVATQLQTHQADCRKAGPNICQIISSSISDNEDIKSANLVLRAEPKWLEGFRAGFEKSAHDNGGKIVNSQTSTEDLTRQITDNEARLRAQTLLRTRLESILATHQGKMADLLEAQSKLAEVQGEIDAMNSELAIAKARVQMSQLNLDYTSRVNAVSNSAFAPLADAFTSFFRIMSESLAFVIKAIAALLPLGIIIVPLFMWIRKLLASRKAKKEAAKA